MRAYRSALVLVLAACSGGEQPPPPSSAPASVEPTTVAPPPTAVPPTVALVDRVDAAAALRDARTLAHAGDYEQAWTRLAPLVETSGPPAFQCEAGYVAFRAGHVDRALPLVRAAADAYPVPEDRAGRVALAQCLYNVGLVSEAAGDLAAAVSAYQRSFSLRANRTVYDHLAAASVRADGAYDQAETERVTAIVRRAVGPSPSFDALATGLTDYCAAGRYHPSVCTATVVGRWPAPEGTGPLLEAALVRSVAPDELYLAVRDATGARLIGVADPGDTRDGDTQVTSARYEELVPPAGLELVLDLETVADDSWYGGNDCDSEERGCDGAARRRVVRTRIVCSPTDVDLTCVAIRTMDLLFHAEPYDAPLPCDAPPPALPFGVGWVGDASIAPGGTVTLTARAIASEGVQCPDGSAASHNDVSLDEEPLEDPPMPPARGSIAFATLAADAQRQLGRGLPRPPTPSAPPALSFAVPWTPPYHASAADDAPLVELVDTIARSCEVEAANDSPRCCPWDGRCTATVAGRTAEGTAEAALVQVVCPGVDVDGSLDQYLWVITRGTVGGDHRVMGTLRSGLLAEGEHAPAAPGMRLLEMVASPGLELHLLFRAEVAAPVMDQRTHIEADSRSTTDVEVICTSGDEGHCYGLPIAYRGSQLAAGDDGHAAVIASTSYRVTITTAGDQLTFTTVDGTPPAALTGSHTLTELASYQVRAWSEGEPEQYY